MQRTHPRTAPYLEEEGWDAPKQAGGQDHKNCGDAQRQRIVRRDVAAFPVMVVVFVGAREVQAAKQRPGRRRHHQVVWVGHLARAPRVCAAAKGGAGSSQTSNLLVGTGGAALLLYV